MKNKFLLLAVAVAAMGIGSVQAIPITGGISYAGGYTIPAGDTLLTATAITFTSATTTGASGTYAGILNGTAVTSYSPLPINPTSTPIIGLWTVGIYSFDALTLVQSAQTATTLTLSGTGTLHDGVVANDTPGQWLATFNTLSGTYSFSASTGAVPDGGMTVMLLGAGLSGLALLRRKLA